MSDPTKLSRRFIATAVGLAGVTAAVLGLVLSRPSVAPVAPDPGASVTATAARRAGARPCPEAVRRDRRGEPRNAAGLIRNCWPTEPKCSCDRDNDCYRLPGYVACVPPTTARDAGATPPPPPPPPPPRDAGTAPTPADAGATPPPPAIDAGATASVVAAFPGAEGWGAAATGGRGGRVIYVTNLNASGPGSFQDAVQQSGPRYVLFRVSGVIHGDVQISQGDLTIAGQTSPGGITVRGLHTTELAYCDQQCGPNARGVQNFIIRHVRSRPAGSDFPDALRLRYARLGVVDHCSMGNAQDEAVEISYANRVTVQNSILAETVGDHAQYGGMLINYTNPAAGYALDQLAILRNAWIRLQGRFPEFSRESAGAAAGTTMRVELTNNLLWDQRFYTNVEATDVSGDDQGRPVHYQMNRAGNFSFVAPAYRYGQIWMRSKASGTTAFFADNRVNIWSALADWQLNYCCNDFSAANAGAAPSWARATRHDFPPVRTMPASAVPGYVVSDVGAFPRDAMDRRLIAAVASGVIDPRRSDANPAGDALAGAFSGSPPAPPTDTDGDGMPDAWERANGTDPAAQDHNGAQLSQRVAGVAGYTNLECYLNQLADRLVHPPASARRAR